MERRRIIFSLCYCKLNLVGVDIARGRSCATSKEGHGRTVKARGHVTEEILVKTHQIQWKTKKKNGQLLCLCTAVVS